MSTVPVYYFFPQVVMDGLYRCRLGSLGNSSTAPGSGDPGVTVAVVMSSRHYLIFRAHFSSFHFHSFLLAIILCCFAFFQYCCSNAHVFGRTLVQEFHILYS